MNLSESTVKDTRVYRDDATGKVYPSVSAVLDLLFPGQMQWVDQAALDEGQRCHDDMKKAINGFLETGIWMAAKSLHRSRRVAALVQYLSDHHFRPTESECSHHSSTYGYAGTPDAALKRGEFVVIPDWKFAESIDQRYLFQLQAYRRFFGQQPLPALMLFRVGKDAIVKPTPVKPSSREWALFLNALSVVKFRLR